MASPMRIAVMGPDGVGKTLLSNLLCGSKDKFQANKELDDLEDLKHRTQSKHFSYAIDGKDQKVEFEVIDTFEIFDLVIEDLEERYNKHKKSLKEISTITENGISAYLILVERGRNRIEFVETFRFVMKYFTATAKQYVWMVVTRAAGTTSEQILKELDTERAKKEKGVQVIREFLSEIGQRLITVDCCYRSDEDYKAYRDEILQSVYNQHHVNGGPFTDALSFIDACKYVPNVKRKSKDRRILPTYVHMVFGAIFFGIIVYYAWNKPRKRASAINSK